MPPKWHQIIFSETKVKNWRPIVQRNLRTGGRPLTTVDSVSDKPKLQKYQKELFCYALIHSKAKLIQRKRVKTYFRDQKLIFKACKSKIYIRYYKYTVYLILQYTVYYFEDGKSYENVRHLLLWFLSPFRDKMLTKLQ